MPDSDARPLPRLREELEVVRGAPNPSGGAQWLIYDPLRHRYFSIDTDAALLLHVWRETTEEDFIADASYQLGRQVSKNELSELLFFLYRNTLTECAAEEGGNSYAKQAQAARRSLLSQAVHSYLFVRIPMVRPHKFLESTLPIVDVFFLRITWICILIIGVIGLYLVSRQWDSFIATFLDFLSFDGVLAYGVALVAIKILHELGHAYTATRHGVRVTSMGVAFMVMMPLLYTDVSNAWRLRSRRKRLQINGAGIAVELGLACIATCLWAFLPDGTMRSAAFITATSSWIISLAVNLNPFMKFDGYYLLADGLGIANIQTRAFALARWQLREWLFDLRQPQPDEFQNATANMLAAYAWAVWIYRLILFIGIALIVYHLFFKLLGVILFAIEIVWFIALPIGKEIYTWWNLRSEIMSRKRTIATASLIAGCVVVLVVPIRWSIVLPAVIQSQDAFAIHAPRAAQITSWDMHEGRRVNTGDVLSVLHAPKLEDDLARTAREIALLDLRLARIAGDSIDLAQRSTIEEERRARLEEQAGVQRQIDALVLRAPFGGELRDVDHDIHSTIWVDRTHRLARLVRSDRFVVHAYVSEDVLSRLDVGTKGEFVPDDLQLGAIDIQLDEISETGVLSIDVPYLASVFGGAIPSERDADDNIRPRKSQYLVTLSPETEWPIARVVRGVVHLPGKAESLGQAIWRRIFSVLVRESGI